MLALFWLLLISEWNAFLNQLFVRRPSGEAAVVQNLYVRVCCVWEREKRRDRETEILIQIGLACVSPHHVVSPNPYFINRLPPTWIIFLRVLSFSNALPCYFKMPSRVFGSLHSLPLKPSLQTRVMVPPIQCSASFEKWVHSRYLISAYFWTAVIFTEFGKLSVFIVP